MLINLGTFDFVASLVRLYSWWTHLFEFARTLLHVVSCILHPAHDVCVFESPCGGLAEHTMVVFGK